MERSQLEGLELMANRSSLHISGLHCLFSAAEEGQGFQRDRELSLVLVALIVIAVVCVEILNTRESI